MITEEVTGLDVAVSQTITSAIITNPRSLERLGTGVQWNGGVVLQCNDKPLGNRAIRRAIASASMMTYESLTAVAQELYTKDYDDLTVAEVDTVQGTTLGRQIVAAVAAVESGITQADLEALVTAILTSVL